MAQKKSLTGNVILNVLLRISSILFPLISYPYVSRVLQPEGIGKVSFATSVANYFLILAQLGIPTYGIHVCAKVREDKKKLSRIVHELFLLNMITTVLSYVVLGATIVAVPKFYEAKELILIRSVAILLNTLGMEWLYRALEQYKYMTIRAFAVQVLSMIALFLFVHHREDYAIYAVIMVFAGHAFCILNFFHARKFISVRWLGGYRLKPHIKGVIVLFAMTCVTMVYMNLDTVMLGMMRDDVQVGYYNVSVSIKSVLVNTIATIGTVLLPRTSMYYEKGMIDAFYQTSKKAMHAVFLVAVPLAVYFILFAGECVEILSGKEFAGAVLPMQIIMPTLLAIGITNIIGVQILVPMGKEKYTLYSVIAGAVTDLVLNALFIPKYGACGAAFGTLMAEFVVLGVQYFYLRKLGKADGQTSVFGVEFLHEKEQKKQTRMVSYGKVFLSVLASVILMLAVKQLSLSAFPMIVISAVLFFGTYGGLLLCWKEPLVILVAGKFFGLLKHKK